MMKLLFDQNISFRLIKKIADVFPESKQIRELKLENATDLEIFEFARKYGYTIVTFDADFCDLNILKGFPPKIIWLRNGNTTTKNLERLFRNKQEIIELFLSENYGCLEIIE
jgi:predicted nuclease of predicted toxin-antitoxin system